MKSIQSFAFVMAVLLLASCASSPTKKWAQSRELLTTGQNVVAHLHDSGKVSDAEIVALNDIVQGARAALEVAATFLPDGGSDFVSYMKIVQAALNKLAELQAERQTNGNRSNLGPHRPSNGTDQWTHESGPVDGRQERNYSRATGGSEVACWRI